MPETTRLRATAAAARLGISEWMLKRDVRAGKIPHYVVGNRYEFDPEELDRYLAAQHRPAQPAAS
jgi:excisionase family DNA binding protein